MREYMTCGTIADNQFILFRQIATSLIKKTRLLYLENHAQ